MNGKSIFLKYLLVGNPLYDIIPYYRSILPGIKKVFLVRLLTEIPWVLIKIYQQIKKTQLLK